ncbi:MAG: putative collagen-binding domain-containing protein, partial [Pseudomonadota bacterium]
DVPLSRQAAWRYFTNGAYYTVTRNNLVIWDDRLYQAKYLKDFIDGTGFQKLEPHQELVDRGDCLANPGNEYVVYLSNGGNVTVNLSDISGSLQAKWYNPRTGEYQQQPPTTGGGSRSFKAPDSQDWALHIRVEASDVTPPEVPTDLRLLDN